MSATIREQESSRASRSLMADDKIRLDTRYPFWFYERETKGD